VKKNEKDIAFSVKILPEKQMFSAKILPKDYFYRKCVQKNAKKPYHKAAPLATDDNPRKFGPYCYQLRAN